jgi:hypothetical protein
MKVVTQLIHHFWGEGALTIEQAELLVRQGFVDASDLKGLLGRTAKVEAPVSVLEERLDVIADELTLRTAVARRRKKGSKARVIGKKGLRLRLRAAFDQRSANLPALVHLARTIAPCSGWVEAALVLRNARDEVFHRSLCDVLRTHPAMFRDLWRAVDPEPFQAMAVDPAFRGRVANAFRVFVQSDEVGSLGKYVWILGLPEVAVLDNLMRIHRRLRSTLGI